ncbi:MAG TPA: hypothetical protein VMG30_17930 [Acidobacteriota bacterium]|nr:hypothetical protein [Acidobacteriota bacterium]
MKLFGNKTNGKIFQDVLTIHLFLLCFTHLGFAQAITVRVVDVTNGHLLTNYQASISPLYTEQNESSTKPSQELGIQSDKNGIIQISLPEPIPQRLFIKLNLKAGHWQCGSVKFADTQEAIQKGIVGLSPGPKPSKTHVVVKAMPGEIVFLARPMTFFERLLYPLVKE